MKRKTKIVLISGVLVLIPIILVWWFMHITCIRAGIVLDSVTGKPISNAVVCYSWEKAAYFGKAGGRLYETTTDQNGKYFIPMQIIKRTLPFEAVGWDHVLIYKDGYAVYINGHSFYDKDAKQQFNKLYRIVKLYPWREGERSHSDHLAFIGTQFYSDAGYSPLLEKELKNLDKEAENEKMRNAAMP